VRSASGDGFTNTRESQAAKAVHADLAIALVHRDLLSTGRHLHGFDDRDSAHRHAVYCSADNGRGVDFANREHLPTTARTAGAYLRKAIPRDAVAFVLDHASALSSRDCVLSLSCDDELANRKQRLVCRRKEMDMEALRKYVASGRGFRKGFAPPRVSRF
jgi:hypothetical protein